MSLEYHRDYCELCTFCRQNSWHGILFEAIVQYMKIKEHKQSNRSHKHNIPDILKRPNVETRLKLEWFVYLMCMFY